MQSTSSPAKIPQPFAVTGDKTATIPQAASGVTVPGHASWDIGFPPVTMIPVASGGIAPYGQDFNALFYNLTSAARWNQAGGFYKYDSAFATDGNVNGYPKGATLLKSDGSGLWWNSVEGNATNPDAGGVGWADFFSGTSGTVSLTDLASTAFNKGAALVGRGLPVVDSISSLRSLLKTSAATRALVTGYYSAGDGGGGVYFYDAADTSSSDNGGTVIVATDGGRWKLMYLELVSIRQFGCVPGQSGSILSSTLTTAINWASPLGKTLFAPAGTYTFAAQVAVSVGSYGIRLKADSARMTRFSYPSLSGQGLFKITGTSGALVNANIDNIGFDGSSTSYAAEVCGACGQWFKNCDFGLNAVGVVLHNSLSGQFTEYSGIDGGQVQPNCRTALEYRKTSGDRSFHGSGIKNRCLINTSSSAGYSVILVGANCLPYNSPLDMQVWGNATGDLITNNNTGSPVIHNCNWHGTLTFESFSTNIITLASGYARTFFSGPINSINQNINYGILKVTRAFISRSDASFDPLRETYDVSFTGVATGAALDIGADYWPSGAYGSMLLHITLVGANYRYTHTYVACLATGLGGSNTATKIADLQTFNSSGWGASAIGLDSNGKLTITNAGSGFSVSVFVGVSQIGWRQP